MSHTAFRNIWFAQLAAQLADKFLLFSLIILAYHISGGSTSVAVTLLAYTVPAVLFAPPAGVIADRFDRKRIMVWCNVGRAVVVALIPIASLIPGVKDDFIHLLVITLIFSAVGQLFGPAEAAVIPTVLPRQVLITANSMALLTMVLTLVVGGVLAPVISRIDLYAPYWCAVALLAIAGALIFASDIPHLKRHTESPVEESRNRFHQMLVDLQEGVDALRASRGLRLAFAAVPEAMKHFPDLQVHNRITGATFSLLLGVEFGAILIPAVTYLMESTSDAIRGRFFALLYMTINGVSALPVLLAAALADNIGTAQVLGGLGVLLLGGGVGLIAGGLRVPERAPKPTQ